MNSRTREGPGLAPGARVCRLQAADLAGGALLLDLSGRLALLAMLAGEIEVGGRGALHRQKLEPTIELLLGRVAELEAAGQARALAEQRYLDEYPALFPDVRDAWEQQLRAAQEVAAMAVGLGELDGVDLPPPEDEDAISDRARVLLDDLVEPAKATALQKLGEGESAARIATRWSMSAA